MRFFQTVFAGAAFVAAAMALTIDSYPPSVVAGQTYTIAFSPKDSNSYTFVLRKGPSGNLATLDTLTTTATGGTFQWTVPKNLADGTDYALQIKQGGSDNYSGLFALTGGSAAVSSAASSAVMSSARASASASASSAASVSSAMSSAAASASSAANSTMASVILSRTATPSATTKPSSSSATGSSPPQNTGNAAASLVASPLAALVGAFVAFAYLA